MKENETPDLMKNPYQAIVAARNSLRNRDESAQNMRVEMKKLDDEMNDITRKNSEERLTIQELESELIKRRRRAEKCRRLAEAQCSYRNTLEKMIRDAMHQSVVYKEQVRLNQAASSALMARLEAQKAICDAAEKELHKKFNEREELENQVRPELEQARKRSRLLLQDDDLLLDDRDKNLSLYLPGTSDETSLHKELRVYFEEEHKASEAETQQHGEIEEEEDSPAEKKNPEESEKSVVVLEGIKPDENKLEKFDVQEGKRAWSFRAFPVPKEPENVEDEEGRRERGKGNVEKWLQILLENNTENSPENKGNKKIDEIIEKLDRKFPLLEKVDEGDDDLKNNETQTKAETRTESARRSRMSFDLKNTPEKSGREKVVKRSESARAFRRIPSSPSLIFQKGIDCIRKKPVVAGNDDENDYLVKNNFIKSSFKTIKRAVKF